jgi:hypothetical protein
VGETTNGEEVGVRTEAEILSKTANISGGNASATTTTGANLQHPFLPLTPVQQQLSTITGIGEPYRPLRDLGKRERGGFVQLGNITTVLAT